MESKFLLRAQCVGIWPVEPHGGKCSNTVALSAATSIGLVGEMSDSTECRGLVMERQTGLTSMNTAHGHQNFKEAHLSWRRWLRSAIGREAALPLRSTLKASTRMTGGSGG